MGCRARGASGSGTVTDDDALDIRSGGLIAVDTESLRHAAGLLDRLADECDDVGAILRHADLASRRAGLWEPLPAGRADEARDRATDIALALRHRAEVYELIESHAIAVSRGLELATGGDVDTPAGTTGEAMRMWEHWRGGRQQVIDAQLSGAAGPWITAAFVLGSATAAIRAVGAGTLPPDAPPLRPVTRPAVVHEVSRAEVAPPRTLEEIAARMPGGGEGRVRVESYATAAGEREYVVYIAGTQNLGAPYAEPWDMASNLELYLGQGSSSYDATRRALAAAGAESGDRVHIAGHSQGGMIGVRLAREGGYDVGTVVTFATPVEADLDDDVLVVTVRHPDDPIVALTGGGLPTSAGSPESFVAERVVDPSIRWGDVGIGVHQMDEYRETAALVDRSDDPRVKALHVQLATLGTAVGTAVVYGARRDFGARDPGARGPGATGRGAEVPPRRG